ncbi:PAS domain-containing protein [Nocardia sp. NPDC004860]|uniref:PAS domain-containing protein n=1 Tax=Nocardia sp. NPDC004860 TaxID=3154557 RepID=UPI0033B278F4
MHGYAPGEVEPTTDLLLAHKHPGDREQVAEIISRSIAHGEPFSSRHRFIDYPRPGASGDGGRRPHPR